jgi:hypothetical protein
MPQALEHAFEALELRHETRCMNRTSVSPPLGVISKVMSVPTHWCRTTIR